MNNLEGFNMASTKLNRSRPEWTNQILDWTFHIFRLFHRHHNSSSRLGTWGWGWLHGEMSLNPTQWSLEYSQCSSFNTPCSKHSFKMWNSHSKLLVTYHLKQLSVAILYCNKDLVTGVKKENRLADKPPKLKPISQDDINIIALVPKTTLYWFA